MGGNAHGELFPNLACLSDIYDGNHQISVDKCGAAKWTDEHGSAHGNQRQSDHTTQVESGRSVTHKSGQSAHSNEQSDDNNEHSAHKSGHSTHRGEHSDNNNEHTAHKSGHSTHYDEHSTHKSGHSTHNNEHSAHKSGHSTHKSGHSDNNNEHSTYKCGHSENNNEHSAHKSGNSTHKSEHSPHKSGHSTHKSGHATHKSGHSSHKSGHSIHKNGHSSHKSGHSTHKNGHSSHKNGHSTHGNVWRTKSEDMHTFKEDGPMDLSIRTRIQASKNTKKSTAIKIKFARESAGVLTGGVVDQGGELDSWAIQTSTISSSDQDGQKGSPKSATKSLINVLEKQKQPTTKTEREVEAMKMDMGTARKEQNGDSTSDVKKKQKTKKRPKKTDKSEKLEDEIEKARVEGERNEESRNCVQNTPEETNKNNSTACTESDSEEIESDLLLSPSDKSPEPTMNEISLGMVDSRSFSDDEMYTMYGTEDESYYTFTRAEIASGHCLASDFYDDFEPIYSDKCFEKEELPEEETSGDIVEGLQVEGHHIERKIEDVNNNNKSYNEEADDIYEEDMLQGDVGLTVSGHNLWDPKQRHKQNGDIQDHAVSGRSRDDAEARPEGNLACKVFDLRKHIECALRDTQTNLNCNNGPELKSDTESSDLMFEALADISQAMRSVAKVQRHRRLQGQRSDMSDFVVVAVRTVTAVTAMMGEQHSTHHLSPPTDSMTHINTKQTSPPTESMTYTNTKQTSNNSFIPPQNEQFSPNIGLDKFSEVNSPLFPSDQSASPDVFESVSHIPSIYSSTPIQTVICLEEADDSKSDFDMGRGDIVNPASFEKQLKMNENQEIATGLYTHIDYIDTQDHNTQEQHQGGEGDVMMAASNIKQTLTSRDQQTATMQSKVCEQQSSQPETDTVQPEQNNGQSPQAEMKTVQLEQHIGQSPQAEMETVQLEQHTGQSPQAETETVQLEQHTGQSPQAETETAQSELHVRQPPQTKTDTVQPEQHTGSIVSASFTDDEDIEDGYPILEVPVMIWSSEEEYDDDMLVQQKEPTDVYQNTNLTSPVFPFQPCITDHCDATLAKPNEAKEQHAKSAGINGRLTQSKECNDVPDRSHTGELSKNRSDTGAVYKKERTTNSHTGTVSKNGTTANSHTGEVSKKGTVNNHTGEVSKKGTNVNSHTGTVPKKGTNVNSHTGEVSKKGTNVNSHTGEVSKKGTNVNSHTGEVSKKGTNVNSHTGEVSKKETANSHTEALSKKGTNVNSHTGTVPKKGTNVNSHTGTVPKKGTNDNSHTGEVPKKGTNVNSHTGEVPKKGTNVNSHTGEVSKKGTVNSHTEALSKKGTVNNHSGTVSKRETTSNSQGKKNEKQMQIVIAFTPTKRKRKISESPEASPQKTPRKCVRKPTENISKTPDIQSGSTDRYMCTQSGSTNRYMCTQSGSTHRYMCTQSGSTHKGVCTQSGSLSPLLVLSKYKPPCASTRGTIDSSRSTSKTSASKSSSTSSSTKDPTSTTHTAQSSHTHSSKRKVNKQLFNESYSSPEEVINPAKKRGFQYKEVVRLFICGGGGGFFCGGPQI